MRRAFSLVEVLIVIVILAIVASVLVPAMSQSGVSRLQGAATILAKDIQFVQSQAMNAGQTLQINFVSDTRYQVVDPDGGPDASPAVLRHPRLDYPAHDGQYIVDFGDPGPLRGATIESAQFADRAILEFGKYGEPTAGGEIVLRSGKHQVRIAVAPITGIVTIGELEVASSPGKASQLPAGSSNGNGKGISLGQGGGIGQ